MRRIATVLLVVVVTTGCTTPESAPVDTPTSTATQAGDTTPPTSDQSTQALEVIAEPTTPLFTDERDAIWDRAWQELDTDALASFFADDALINGTTFDKAMAEARIRHPDPMEWVETFEDCFHHNSRFVTCDVRWTSAVHRPAGLEVPVQRAVYLDEDGLITLYRDDVRVDALIPFEYALAAWLEEHHPEIEPVDWATMDYERYAETVRAVLEVVDEFVASSDDYPPGPPNITDPVLTGNVEGVDVYNATDAQAELVAWAIRRFVAAGIPAPPVTHVTFPPTEACERGFSGMSYHSETEGHIDVCTPPEALAATADVAPLTARRTILHELAHLWMIANTDDGQRAEFMDHLGLEAWSGVEWGSSGSEAAAEILMWGVIDDHVTVRIPGATCDDRMTAFELLTGTTPPMRSCD